MHAMLLDSHSDRLDRLQIAFLEAGIHVTGSGNLAVAQCCLKRAMVDVLLIDEVTAGQYLGDLVTMAERRNPKVMTFMLSNRVATATDLWSQRLGSLHAVMEDQSDPTVVARVVKAAMTGAVSGTMPGSISGRAAEVPGPVAQADTPVAKQVEDVVAPPMRTESVLEAKARVHAQTAPASASGRTPEVASAPQSPVAQRSDSYPALKVHPALAAQRAAEADRLAAEERAAAAAERMEQARALARQRALEHAAQVRAAQAEATVKATPRRAPPATVLRAQPLAPSVQPARVQQPDRVQHPARVQQQASVQQQPRQVAPAPTARVVSMPQSQSQPQVPMPLHESQLSGQTVHLEPQTVRMVAAPAAQKAAQTAGQTVTPAPRAAVQSVAAPRPAAQPVQPVHRPVVQPRPSYDDPAPYPTLHPAEPVHYAPQQRPSAEPVPFPQVAPAAPVDDGQPIFQSSRRRLGVTAGALMSA